LLLAGPAQAQFAGGSGTEEDPYQIETIEQLQDVGQEEYRSSHFILIADIDASETAGWNDGKGFEPLRFRGHFDGDGHVITGLTIDRAQENEVGLFGFTYWDSVIKNLGVEDIHITGGDFVGGLVGYKYHTVIQSCYVTGEVFGDWMVGGLIGALHTDLNPEQYWVMSSYADVRVTGTKDVGGLIGGLDLIWPLTGMMRSVYQSFAVGQVTGEETVGGLMGFPKLAIIHDSYWDVEATGQIEGVADSTGTGFIGLTTEQMTGQNAFIYMNKLDFENTWQLTEGYPVLRWQDPEDAVEPPFAGGSGTETDPFQIETIEQLQAVGDSVNLDKHFLQTADIDASETEEWNGGKGFRPIGDILPLSANFSGSYNGDGFVITNCISTGRRKTQ